MIPFIVTEVLPWLLDECTKSPGICDPNLKQRAANIATLIQMKYPEEYNEILVKSVQQKQ